MSAPSGERSAGVTLAEHRCRVVRVFVPNCRRLSVALIDTRALWLASEGGLRRKIMHSDVNTVIIDKKRFNDSVICRVEPFRRIP
jgi:hypothetical protein